MAKKTRLAEWGVSAMTMPGYKYSGDGYVIARRPDGLIIGVIDGLGHGIEAAEVTALAIKTLTAWCRESVEGVIGHCHIELGQTRGAVMAVAFLDSKKNTMTWLGIGNVSGTLFRTGGTFSDEKDRYIHESLLEIGGIVGCNLPSLKPRTLSIHPGDTIIFMTDGLKSFSSMDLDLSQSPQMIANNIMERYGRANDDALVVVCRWKGLK